MHGLRSPHAPVTRPGPRPVAGPRVFALWTALVIGAPVAVAAADVDADVDADADAPSATAAAAAAIDLTDPHRWSETAYGISLRPPEGWTAAPAPRDGNDFAWDAPDGGRLAFKIAYSRVPVQLDQAGVQALVQMGFALHGPRLRRGAEQRTIGNRPGSLMLFDIDPPDGGPSWFYAHAVIMLEPYAAAVVKIQSDSTHADAALARFEEVLASLHVPLGSELESLRRPQIDLGVAWLNALPAGALAAAVPEESWYRLCIDGKDVGHRRVVRISDPVALALEPELRRRGFVPPGTAVVLQDHRQRDGVALDRSLYAYAEADGEIEIWDLKQTLRRATDTPGDAGLPGRADGDDGDDAVTWVETGTRGPRGRRGTTAQHLIEVVQEVPPTQRTVAGVRAQESFLGSAGVAAARDNQGRLGGSIAGRTHHRRWQTPETGYLGQIQAMGLPAAMPRDPGTAFAFYAWDPASGDLALRTVRVGPDPEGAGDGYVVYERPAPSSAETRHRFAADGTHLESLIPGGLTVIPTTRAKLAASAPTP